MEKTAQISYYKTGSDEIITLNRNLKKHKYIIKCNNCGLSIEKCTDQLDINCTIVISNYCNKCSPNIVDYSCDYYTSKMEKIFSFLY